MAACYRTFGVGIFVWPEKSEEEGFRPPLKQHCSINPSPLRLNEPGSLKFHLENQELNIKVPNGLFDH